MKESTKNHYQKACKTLFKWEREARNKDVEWKPQMEYSDPSTTYTPRDYTVGRMRFCSPSVGRANVSTVLSDGIWQT